MLGLKLFLALRRTAFSLRSRASDEVDSASAIRHIDTNLPAARRSWWAMIACG